MNMGSPPISKFKKIIGTNLKLETFRGDQRLEQRLSNLLQISLFLLQNVIKFYPKSESAIKREKPRKSYLITRGDRRKTKSSSC